jgi:hypothetical protein
MKVFRSTPLAAALAVGLLCLAGSTVSSSTPAAAGTWQGAKTGLPEKLSDAEFWKLATDISEPGGFFRITDNYTSNEREIGILFTMLRDQKVRGGVYMGVGPEQNFSYMAAIQPAMAFIVDIRRQAVMQHLMFKAVFELAKDRADFISLLFAKPRPAGLEDPALPIQRIWEAYFPVQSDFAMRTKTYTRLADQITKVHRFELTAEEQRMFDDVFQAFYSYGPSISTRGGSASGGRGGSNLSFADLTGWMYDANGAPQSFLSTHEYFLTVKRLHERNLIVPVSGDFGGPQAIRAIGAYLKSRGGTVSAFYVSNVEQYLFQDGTAAAFYQNVGTLPLNAASVFIRPYSMRNRGSMGATQSLCGMASFIAAAEAGRVYSNSDALACVK